MPKTRPAFLFVTACWLLALPLAALAAELEPCGYVRTVDGDTIVVEQGGAELHVRLFGIDCPEISYGRAESGGFLAAYAVAALLERAGAVYLECDPVAMTDDFDRALAWVWVDCGDDDPLLLNAELLRLGLARRYKDCQSRLHDAELDAAEDAR